jgi:tRNA threonylcarbamoyladenosine biosynthesis protein TsaB
VTLVLAVETSSFNYEVALSTRNGEVLAQSSIGLRDPKFRSIGYQVEELLATAGHEFADVDELAVDVGPGNVISVRAGISYVNGLAFSLQKPVLSVDSLTLLAAETGAAGHLLCVRRAAGGNMNAALFHAGARLAGLYGRPEDIVAVLLNGIDEVTVAGVGRGQIADVASAMSVTDSSIELPTVATLCRLAGTAT